MPRMSAAALQRALAEGRRGARRYEIALPLRFAALRRGEAPVTGAGVSVNLSRTGTLFRCDERLVVGDSLVIVLDWPVAAQDDQSLKLVVTGHAVRVRRGLVGMVIHTHRLLRESELDKRLSVLWGPVAEKSVRSRREPQGPLVLIEDDDSVALLVSMVVTAEKWTVERANVARAKEILVSGEPAISLLITRTPELVEMLRPDIPAILTLDEDAPEGASSQFASNPLRVIMRRPLTDVGVRSLIGILCAPARLAGSGGAAGESVQ